LTVLKDKCYSNIRVTGRITWYGTVGGRSG